MYVILVGSWYWVVQFSLMSCHQNTKGADILRLVWYFKISSISWQEQSLFVQVCCKIVEMSVTIFVVNYRCRFSKQADILYLISQESYTWRLVGSLYRQVKCIYTCTCINFYKPSHSKSNKVLLTYFLH